MSTQNRLPLYAVASPEESQLYQQGTKDGDYALTTAEKFWRDRYSFLANLGYTLRPRYAPQWKPSWIGTNLVPIFCEDSIDLVVYDSFSVPILNVLTRRFASL